LVVVSIIAWISTAPLTIHEAITDALHALDLWAKVSVTILVADEDRIFCTILDQVSDEAHLEK